MITIDLGTGDDGRDDGEERDLASSLLVAVAAPVRRWPERRVVVLGGACVLFVAILVARQLVSGTGDALSLIYVIPVALVALELGLWAGLIAALAAAVAVVAWMASRQSGVDAVALAVRCAIFFSVAAIAGRFSDRMRQHSVQAARLLVVERQQAALRTELERMRCRLDEQLRNASRVLDRHEQERRGIARKLHEETAQTMAAALMTLGMLERGPQRELTRGHLEEARMQVKASIADLRRIAGGLRPSVLDELGLSSALARISELEAERGRRTVTFSTEGVQPPLEPEIETSAYRVIEETLEALQAASSIETSLAQRRGRLAIVMDARFAADGAPEADEEVRLHSDLLATRARMELIGGSLRIGSLDGARVRLVAELPLGGERESVEPADGAGA